MTELEQFAADPNAAPPRVARRHLQNQLLDLRIETWPTRATSPTERRPPPPHQLVMPTENRLRLDKHPDQSRTGYPLAQRCHDRPIRHLQLRPLDLTAYDSKLVPQQKQLYLRVVDSQPYINQIEKQPKPGVHESKEHRRSKS
jgi:hypothetical protein